MTYRKSAQTAAAIIASPLAGLLFVYVSAVLLGEYGWTLFLATPVVMGFASTVIYAPTGGEGFGKCLLVSFSSILAIGVLMIVIAIEGLICLGMALPLALPLNIVGVLIAYLITNRSKSPVTGLATIVVMVLSLPLLLGFEISHKSKPTMHKVITTVEIDAPIERVWSNVIAFPQINSEPTGVLSLGFAYPINAEISGTGVGAIRRCNFNTGPFVEPITDWQEPNLLAFDVKEQPAPMIEMSPYDHLQAAHLDYIRSQKGQFRLYRNGNKTVLEGTTFYTHDIAPDIYWNLFSDEIIHQIHLRVLDHIKAESEK
jgi:hypothetical protein